ncbi:hypothetical protein ACFXGG_08680 [Streptomyces nigra]|jgi:hypothetical protein|uniref:hypothetical protein n=1 Tax=Streptomyces TaxID=1883 RepID=UPI001F25F503|nr:hypothetical protein [Streptomyces sp. FB2]MCF2536210.1 hypothetical protein [Streptomyces sp. FB2]
MPKPLRMSRRVWIAAWVVLCVAGGSATVALNTSRAPESRPEKPVSPECAEYIADVEAQLAEAERDGVDDGVLAFSRSRVGAEDCHDALLDHFGGDR